MIVPAGHRGFQEILVSVGDIETAASQYCNLLEFQELHRGPADPALLKAYDLAGMPAEEVVLKHPHKPTGFLRLVQFGDGRHPMIRPCGRTWDTGGIFDFNVRVRDIHEVFDRATRRGFSAYGAPAEFQWAQFKVWEVVLHGPDGVAIALIQPVEPGPDLFLGSDNISHVFNATQVVPDLQPVRAMYGDALGFEIFVDDSFAAREPGQKVLGLPVPLADTVQRNICILHPDGSNEGSLEFLQFEGIEGLDFADRAIPPNRGLLAFRFPVPSVIDVGERAFAGSIPVAFGPIRTTIAPYGDVDIICLTSPTGTRLEFFSPV